VLKRFPPCMGITLQTVVAQPFAQRVSMSFGRQSARILQNSLRAILQTVRAPLIPPLFIAGVLAVPLAGYGGGSDANQADKDKAAAAAKFRAQ
jgi:hypothetical protein